MISLTPHRGILAVAVASLLSAPAAADTIVLGGGKRPRQNVIVQKETCKEVTFKSGGPASPDVNMPAVEVATIVYDDAPDAFKLAGTEFGQKRWAEASAQYEKAKSAKAGPWLPLYCAFFMGECAMNLADGDAAQYDVAIGHYKALLAAQPDTRFLAAAKAQMAAAYRRKKDFKNAEAVLRELMADVDKYGLEKRVGVRAELELARLLEADAKFADAYGRYMSLAGRSGVDAEVANLAKMRAGLCLVNQQKFSEAQSHFAALLAGAGLDEGDVRAGAHVGLGHCFYQQKDWVQARYQYLTVSALYGTSEHHAEALYGAAQSWVQREEQETLARGEALKLLEELIILHPKSPFEPKAYEDAIKLGANKAELDRKRKK